MAYTAFDSSIVWSSPETIVISFPEFTIDKDFWDNLSTFWNSKTAIPLLILVNSTWAYINLKFLRMNPTIVNKIKIAMKTIPVVVSLDPWIHSIIYFIMIRLITSKESTINRMDI